MKTLDNLYKDKCRLCQGRKLKLLYKFPEFTVVGCRLCNFVQIREFPGKENIYDYYSDNFFKRGKYIKDQAIKNSCQRRIGWLESSGVQKQAKVLEVGCATGDFIESAKSHFEMCGVDISAHFIEIAKNNNPDVADRIKCGMVENIKYPADYFDAIVLWDVISNLWNPLGDISKLAGFLKPGGIMTLSAPNIGSFMARISGRYWPLMIIPEHLGYFDYNTMNMLMDNAGLKVVDWKSVGTWANVGFLINKLARAVPAFSFLEKVINHEKGGLLGKLSLAVIYVPTGDIQYVAARKLFSQQQTATALRRRGG